MSVCFKKVADELTRQLHLAPKEQAESVLSILEDHGIIFHEFFHSREIMLLKRKANGELKEIQCKCDDCDTERVLDALDTTSSS